MAGFSRHTAFVLTAGGMVLLVAGVLLGRYFFANEPAPTAPAADGGPPPGAAGAPAAAPTPATGESAATPAQVAQEPQAGPGQGDSAREYIAAARAAPGGADLDQVYQEALAYLEEGRTEGAHLLLFFAAREGHGPAALRLGALYDPAQTAGLAAVEGDAGQALKWYRVAAEAGAEGASRPLEELRARVEQAAREGDPEARRLMMEWR